MSSYESIELRDMRCERDGARMALVHLRASEERQAAETGKYIWQYGSTFRKLSNLRAEVYSLKSEGKISDEICTRLIKASS